MTVNLAKSAEAFRVSLSKRGVEKMPPLEMAAALDVSGSFKDEHADGLTTTFLTRIVPWGMTFDPDGKIDVFTFSSGTRNAHYVGAIEEANYQNYVRREIIDKVPGYGLGTDYAPVLRLILSHFGWLEDVVSAAVPKRGLFARLFGRKDNNLHQSAVETRRSIVFFVTDGENGDPEATEKVVSDAEKSGYDTFFVFVGISNQNTDFGLLRRLSSKYGNSVFRKIEDIDKFNRLSDDDLNDFFLDVKLTRWLAR